MAAKKKKVSPDKDILPEVEKEMFRIQAQDLNNKLSRIRERCIFLEKENEKVVFEKDKLDRDRSDVIAHLKRTNDRKTEELAELTARINAMEETNEAERQVLLDQIKNLHADLKESGGQFTAEIKLLNGKLSALEDFRLQREELMKKFVRQEEEIEAQEERHKITLNDIEKKYLISKDKLRQEMEQRLVKLSLEFQKATQTRIASTTQAVLRENITVNNELNVLIGSWKALYEENEKLRQEMKTDKFEIKLATQLKNEVQGRNLTLNSVVDRLAVDFNSLLDRFSDYQGLEERNKQQDEHIRKLNNTINGLEAKIRYLERRVHAALVDSRSVILESREKSRHAKYLEDSIVTAMIMLRDLGVELKTVKVETFKETSRKCLDLINDILETFSLTDMIKTDTPEENASADTLLIPHCIEYPEGFDSPRSTMDELKSTVDEQRSSIWE